MHHNWLFLTGEEIPPVQIHLQIDDDCADRITVHRWAKNIQIVNSEGWICVTQEENGWSLTATDEFHMTKVDELTKDSWRSLKGKLLSILAFPRNVWVTLLVLALCLYETAMFCRKLDSAIL